MPLVYRERPKSVIKIYHRSSEIEVKTGNIGVHNIRELNKALQNVNPTEKKRREQKSAGLQMTAQSRLATIS